MKTRNSDDPLVPTWVLRLVALGSIVVLVGAATPTGAQMAGDVQRFLSFYAGVFALLALTTSVVSGLLATERLVLAIRHRVLAQSVHRAASMLALTFVVSHLLVKVLGGFALPAQAVVPFVAGGALPIGYGALAFDLLVVVAVSGLLRARFARRGRAWVWRAVHSLAYVSWPVAIGHGLTAGRSAANWVTLSYVLCVAVVALAVLTRMFVIVRPREPRRAGADSTPPDRRAPGRRAPARGAVQSPEDAPRTRETTR